MPTALRIGSRPLRSHRLVLGALALLVVLALVDLAVGLVLFVPLFVLAPVGVALRGAPSETAVAGTAAVALAILSGAWNDALGTGRWWVGLLLVAVGSVAAMLAAVRRLRLQHDAERLELLVELGDGAAGATVEETAARLGGLLVPLVADACLVELAGDDGARRVAGTVGTDAAALAETSPPDEPALCDPMPPGAPPALRSCLSVPLRARGRTIGTLRMGVGPSGRRFGPRDLRFAGVLADRVALALENAGLSAELEDAERRFRAIVDGMLDGVTVRAADGRLVYANDAAIDLLRIDSRDDLRDRRPGAMMAMFDVTDEQGRPVQLDQLPGVRAWNLDDDPEPMIVRNVVRATGEQRWLLSKAIAIRDADGVPLYVVNFTEDVTAVKRAELAQRVLAEAGRVLVSSLDYAETLQQVARLAVPDLADWCGVDMPRTGLIEPVAISHVDAEKVAVARELRGRYPVRMDEPEGLAAVMRGDARYYVVDETPDAALVAFAADERHLELMRGVGFNSIMIVPVVGRSGVVGTLTFVSALPRRFDEDDLELALELGRRAGVAVENARLYSERADIAHTLQIALVPDPVPLAPGWDIAALYRPAGEATEAGGDFYDMVRTDDGWLVVIGDVAGKGARAASLTALARYTLRTAAMLTGDPAAALAALNSGLMRRRDVAYCTAALVALEEDGDGGGGARARVFSAGHPLPVLLSGGAARELGRSGPLLGALEGADWPGEEVVLGAGDRLVLYTDGVTDARGAEDRFGDDRLLELLSGVDGAAPAEVVQAIDGALQGFQAGPQRDDTALLAVGRLQPGELALAGGPEAVSLARAAVRARLENDLPPERLGDVLLMTSELVTNAIRHGAANGPDDRIRLRAVRRGARARIEVRDDGPGFDAHPPLDPPTEGGMGLELVNRLADAWGTDRRGRTTVVWFEVEPDRPGPQVH